MNEGGQKHDQGKARWDLLPFAALDQVAQVMTFGAGKYGDRNYEKGMKWGRLLGAALRHLSKWARGMRMDDESGLPHLAHAAACCLMLLTLTSEGGIAQDLELGKHQDDDRSTL